MRAGLHPTCSTTQQSANDKQDLSHDLSGAAGVWALRDQYAVSHPQGVWHRLAAVAASILLTQSVAPPEAGPVSPALTLHW